MGLSVGVRLRIMMFLNYVIWGAWYVTLGTYLTQTLNFSGTQAGAIFGTAGAVVHDFALFRRTDRRQVLRRGASARRASSDWSRAAVPRGAADRIHTGLPAAAGLLSLLFSDDRADQFAHPAEHHRCGRAVPIDQNVRDHGLDRGRRDHRIHGDGEILDAVHDRGGVLAGHERIQPHAASHAAGREGTDDVMEAILGLDALVMMKDRSYAVFVVASVLACIPLTFYFSFTNAYLNEAGMTNAAGKMTLGQVSEVGMMLLMPIIYRRFSLKWILLGGLLAWSARYVFLAYGNNAELSFLFYAAILLHGICYDFFFMTGQLYTDQQAPAHLRGTAQGFIQFLTYGIGMFIGSLLSGVVVDYFTVTTDGIATRNWTAFWLTSATGAFVIFLMVAALFQSRGRVQTQEVAAVAGD